MVAVEDAVTYPLESDNALTLVLVGGVLSLLSFLIIPLLIVSGYLVSVIRARFDGEAAPPAFENWGDLLVDGLKVTVIGFVYLLIPVLVAAATVGGAMLAIATGTRGGVAAGLGGLFGGFMLSFALFLVFGYVAVAAIVNFAHEDSLDAGFDFGRIKTVALSREFAVGWLASVGVFFVANLISGALNFIPVLGTLFAPFVLFYAQMVAAYLWADGFGESVDVGSRPERATRAGVR